MRQEADSSRRGYRAVPAHSRRPERGWLPFAGGVVVALALVAVAISVWPRTGEHAVGVPVREEPLAVPGEVLETAEPQVPDREPPAVASEESAPGPVSETETVVSEDDPSTKPRAGDAREAVSLEAAPQSLAEAGPPVEGGSPVSGLPGERAAGRLEPGATYRRTLTSADGATLTLDGLAYSETRPFAMINGAIVSPGDMIAGFVVVAIEPERVELDVDGMRVYLTPR